MADVHFDALTPDEVLEAYKLESDGYPPDEAASLETLQFRHAHAPYLFLGAFAPTAPRTLLGFVTATLSASPTLTHESFTAHDPAGRTACVHSVVVRASHRRQGLARALLAAFLARLAPAISTVLLLAHEELCGLYASAGFDVVGPSAVAHGSRPWIEMRWTRTQEPAREPSQADVLAALAAASAAPRPAGDLGVDLEGAEDGTKNERALLCPREGCGSLILLPGAAELRTRASPPIDPPAGAHPLLAPLGGESARWWVAGPSPMAFENIGFSRPVAPAEGTGAQLKLLVCGECEIGPVGWCEVGGREFWVSAGRVRYRA